MKTLIEKTNSYAKYEFTHDTAKREVHFEKQDGSTEPVNFEALADEEYAKWMKWLGVTQ
jgi:hypothetical protein